MGSEAVCLAGEYDCAVALPEGQRSAHRPCEGASHNEYGYVLVTTDAAADNRGWMRSDAVVQI
ncbi:hypothetical protein GA0115253_101884 [Streptomyces sp. Termitarium-T10T-6]|nr:hypothetical protein [Streptomyces sp. Termitarium-T10T-6]SCD80453.1 hypothetical protein GA0115253_101884 [Streptomyces sp. Termitarium-T10T-6]